MSSLPFVKKLADEEEHYWVPHPKTGRSLFLRLLRSKVDALPKRRPVIYLHGATFPSALSIAYRFGGRSWRDALCEAGFDVWGLDFQGFGGSDRYPEMDEPASAQAPLCKAADAAEQLEAAVRFILGHQGVDCLSIISHSWGSMPAGLFAGRHPALVDRWVLFAPIVRRSPRRYEPIPDFPAWKLVSMEDQWNRFVEDVPPGEPPVLSKTDFDAWTIAYLDSDPDSRARDPMAVKTPMGPFAEIIAAWHGELAYDPALVQAPVAIVRGSWDGLVPDRDARWLFDAFSRSPHKQDIKISRGTHLMHLEAMRPVLWRQSVAFLLGEEVA